jgi:uncharacterized protein
MLESLRNIKNPIARSLTAAATIGSGTVLAASLILGITKAKTPDAYQAALYATLAGSGGGALLGLVTTTRRASQRASQPAAEPQDWSSAEITDTAEWQDWRNFIVSRTVKESAEITSFYLRPEDGQAIPNFQPGQFLTIKLVIPGQAKSVIRTYTLSDYTEPCEYYRLSIKRETMPEGIDVPAGLASNFMHDHIQVGSTIAAKPPSGKFILHVNDSLPAVLISNGVGITPMISMAKAASLGNPDRPIWFVHGARNGPSHAFQDEVMHLAQRHPNLIVHYVYSRPTERDTGRYHSTGYVDAALIQHLVTVEAEYFLCGSMPFLQSLRQGLQQAGVPERQIAFEVFTKAPAGSTQKMPATPTETATGTATGEQRLGNAEIVFAKSGITATWQPEEGSILEFAEANGLEPDYSCREGICGTCMCKLRSGEVEYQQTPIADIQPGSVLICIAHPKTAIVLDL